MKKLVLGLFVIAAMSVNAQIEQGSLFFGGSLGFGTTSGSTDNISSGTTTSIDNASTFRFQLIPQAGYMVTENIGVGLGIGYSLNKTTTPNGITGGTDPYDQISKSGAFVIAPFARYYKGVSDKFYLFGEFGLPIIMGSTSDLKLNDDGDGTVDNDDVNKYSSFGIDLSLGVDYFVTDNIALEAGINLFGMDYTSTKSTYTDKDAKNGTISHDSSFNFDFDSSDVFNTGNISVGIKIFM